MAGSLWPSAISPATILPKGPLNASIKRRTRRRRDSSAVRTVGIARLGAIRSQSMANTKVALVGHLGRLNPNRSTKHVKENAMNNQIHPYEPLTSENAALVLVDHQVGLMTGVRDYSTGELKHNVVALAKAAKALKLPIIVTTTA